MIDTAYVLAYIRDKKKDINIENVEIVNSESFKIEPIGGVSLHRKIINLQPLVEVTIRVPYEELKAFQESEENE